MTFGLVHARYSSPKWQAVKLTFFALILRHQPQRALVLNKKGEYRKFEPGLKAFFEQEGE